MSNTNQPDTMNNHIEARYNNHILRLAQGAQRPVILIIDPTSSLPDKVVAVAANVRLAKAEANRRAKRAAALDEKKEEVRRLKLTEKQLLNDGSMLALDLERAMLGGR